MKKNSILIIIGVLIVLVIGTILFGINTNNNFVTLQEEVNSRFSDVDVALQRRADLIPNLVSAIKGYMEHEEKIISDITTARENLVNAKDITEKDSANSELTRSLNALMVVVENYPDLKANENFINLQDELAGTENRIAIARRDYNDAAKRYNIKVKKFPTNIIASMFNFERVEYFSAEEGKTDVPIIDF